MNLAVLQVFYPVFSGVIEGFAISSELIPYGSPFLALFCLAPLYTALYKSRSYLESFVIFFIQVLTVHMISSYWLANFHGFAAFTLGASAAGTAFQGGIMGVVTYAYPAIFQKDKNLKDKAGMDCLSIFKRMLWFSAVWVLFEYEKSVGALGYPWGTVSMAAYNWKIFTQIADITGVYGITFIYALFSCLFAEGIRLLGSKNNRRVLSNYKQALVFTTAIFALTGIYGIFQYLLPRTPEKFFNAVLVQQNIDPWESGDKESIEISERLTKDGIEKFKETGKEADLIVWSEGVLGKSFPGARFYYSRFPEELSLKDFIRNTNIPFLIGGTSKTNSRKKQYANSAILFDRQGEYSGFYSKIQLVPFAEKIPYYENPLMNFFMKNVVGFNSTLTSGFQYVLFKIPLKTNMSDMPPLNTGHKEYETIELDSSGVSNAKKTELYINGAGPNPDASLNFTTPICFEDAFPTICRNLYNMGSEIFLNITNDSWSKTKSSEMQHFIVSSYLATEFRTTLVRCANSGYTVVVDPAGKILADLPLFEEGSLSYSIPVYERKETIYSRYGDWFVKTLALSVFVFMALVLFNIWFPCITKKIQESKRVIIIEKEVPVYISVSSDIIEEPKETKKKTVATKRKSLKTVAPKELKSAAKRKSPAAKTAVKKTETITSKTEAVKEKKTATKTKAAKSKKSSTSKASEEKVSTKKSSTKTTPKKTEKK